MNLAWGDGPLWRLGIRNANLRVFCPPCLAGLGIWIKVIGTGACTRLILAMAYERALVVEIGIFDGEGRTVL